MIKGSSNLQTKSMETESNFTLLVKVNKHWSSWFNEFSKYFAQHLDKSCCRWGALSVWGRGPQKPLQVQIMLKHCDPGPKGG